MTAFEVPLEVLVDVADRIGALEQQLDARLVELDARVGPLHGTWSGAAADEQLAAHRRWLAGAREMQAALSTLRAIASLSHANYHSALSANRRMWAGPR
jgi:WXG100 family type VII secretion target